MYVPLHSGLRIAAAKRASKNMIEKNEKFKEPINCSLCSPAAGLDPPVLVLDSWVPELKS